MSAFPNLVPQHFIYYITQKKKHPSRWHQSKGANDCWQDWFLCRKLSIRNPVIVSFFFFSPAVVRMDGIARIRAGWNLIGFGLWWRQVIDKRLYDLFSGQDGLVVTNELPDCVNYFSQAPFLVFSFFRLASLLAQQTCVVTWGPPASDELWFCYLFIECFICYLLVFIY